MPNKYSKSLELYVSLSCDLHALIAAGEGESDEAEALRDRMDDPWDQLSDEEKEIEGLLSEDLYALEEAAKTSGLGEGELGAIFGPIESASLLDTLRNLRSAEPRLPWDMRAAARGMIWSRFGFPYVAHRFYSKASEWAARQSPETGQAA
jgi:hypothetical protein